MCTQEAWSLLKQLTKDDMRQNAAQYTATSQSRDLLRQAIQVCNFACMDSFWVNFCKQDTVNLQIVASNSAPSEGWDPSVQPPQILVGVLSSDIRLAVRALRDWTSALHIPFVVPKSRVSRPLGLSLRRAAYFAYTLSRT